MYHLILLLLLLTHHAYSTWEIDKTLARIKPYSNNTHSSDLHKFCVLYEVLSDHSKCLNKETVIILCTYPAKGPNLEFRQGSDIYNFTTQWTLQSMKFTNYDNRCYWTLSAQFLFILHYRLYSEKVIISRLKIGEIM